MTDAFLSIVNSRKLFDATIRVASPNEENKIEINKMYLATKSKYFETLFFDSQQESQFVINDDIMLFRILDSIMTGIEIKFDAQESFVKFMNMCEKYMFDEIKMVILNRLDESVDFIELLKFDVLKNSFLWKKIMEKADTVPINVLISHILIKQDIDFPELRLRFGKRLEKWFDAKKVKSGHDDFFHVQSLQEIINNNSLSPDGYIMGMEDYAHPRN
jgi:hypothetical protein